MVFTSNQCEIFEIALLAPFHFSLSLWSHSQVKSVTEAVQKAIHNR